MAPTWTPFCPDPDNPERDHRAVTTDICLYCRAPVPNASSSTTGSTTAAPTPRQGDPAPPTAHYTSRGHLPQLPRAQLVPEATSFAAITSEYLPIRPNAPFKGKASGLIKRRGGQGPSSIPPTPYRDELVSFVIFVAHGSSFDITAEDFQWHSFSHSWNISFRTNELLDLYDFRNSLLRVIHDYNVPKAYRHITSPRSGGQWTVAKYHFTPKRSQLTNLSAWPTPMNIRDIIHYSSWQTNRDLKERDIEADTYSVTLQWIPPPPGRAISSSPEPTVEQLPQKAPTPFYVSDDERSLTLSEVPTEAEILALTASGPHKRTISDVTPRAEREQQATSDRPPLRPQPQQQEQPQEDSVQTPEEGRPRRVNKGKKPQRYGQ
jgi:hypothetical protein